MGGVTPVNFPNKRRCKLNDGTVSAQTTQAVSSSLPEYVALQLQGSSSLDGAVQELNHDPVPIMNRKNFLFVTLVQDFRCFDIISLDVICICVWCDS